MAELRRKLATGGGAREKPEIKQVAGVGFLGRLLADVPAKDLKGLADDLKKQLGSGVVALVAIAEGKASLVVGVTDDLTGRLSAVDPGARRRRGARRQGRRRPAGHGAGRWAGGGPCARGARGYREGTGCGLVVQLFQ